MVEGTPESYDFSGWDQERFIRMRNILSNLALQKPDIGHMRDKILELYFPPDLNDVEGDE